MLEKYEEEIQKFSLSTRRDTLEHTANKISGIKVKIEAYASYLKDKSEELLLSVEDKNEKLVKKIYGLIDERKKKEKIIRTEPLDFNKTKLNLTLS